MPQTNNKTARALQLVQWLAPLLASALVAYGTAQFRAGAQESSTGLKIQNLEGRFSQLSDSMVPRKEHEAHWQEIKDLLNSQQTDLRELRTTQKEILLRLTK